MSGHNWSTLGSLWGAAGSPGSGKGQFDSPNGILIGPAGQVYIADLRNHRLVRVDGIGGDNWAACGSLGDGQGQFNLPGRLCSDSSSRIYVADFGNHRIVRVDDMSGSNWTAFP